MKISEVIVVEGKNDSSHLKKYFDVDTIETHGTCLSEFTINLIRKTNELRGVIVLVDPDSPGDYIRTVLNNNISGLKHAYLNKEDARTSKKVGVEHASYEALKKALNNVVDFREVKNNISIKDLYALKLAGHTNSSYYRDIVGKHFNIGKANVKTLVKRLNMLELDIKDIEEVLNDCGKYK